MLLVISALVEFAILGTLLTFVCLLAFTILVHRDKLLRSREIIVLYVATVASITWNTETPSAALLVIVGAAMSWVSFQALVVGRWGAQSGVGR